MFVMRKQRLISAALVVALGILLTGCATGNKGFATFGGVGSGPAGTETAEGGACSAFPAPEYQVKGKTAYDQVFTDKWTEAGIAGCNWPRPQARPPEFDKPNGKGVAMGTVAPTAKLKKPTIWSRVKNKFHRTPPPTS